jgi:glycosyltransferase involved in cell wall biosynthesis
MKTSPGLQIAVDLTPLLPGGKNGGVKPFIFEYMKWLGRQQEADLTFIFLTRRSSHADVRAISRHNDRLYCVLNDSDDEVYSPDHSPFERCCFDAEPDFIRQIGAALLYSPFGQCTWHCPGIPTIATVVDVIHRDYPETLSAADRIHREAVFQDLVRKADLIQCISDFTIDRMVHYYGCSRERMFRSHISIENRLRTIIGGRIPTTDCNPFFLYPANAWAHKNHTCLLLAYRIYRMREGAKAWKLVLTGHQDSAMAEVLKLASTLGIERDVTFLGHIPEDEYADIWRQAGALVFPSMHEGFGIPLVEAMAFGLPVIANRAASLPEVGGDACLFVDARKPIEFADAMYQVGASAEFRDNLRQKGYAQLRTFSFERDAREMLQKIIACSRSLPQPTYRGIYVDGWTEPIAIFNLPHLNRASRIRLRVNPMPAARSFTLRHTYHCAGSFDFATEVGGEVEVAAFARGQPVTINVLNASNLNPRDHRTHGICIKSISIETGDGDLIEIFGNSR